MPEVTPNEMIEGLLHEITRTHCHFEDVDRDLSVVADDLDELMKVLDPSAAQLLGPFAGGLQAHLHELEQVDEAIRVTLTSLRRREAPVDAAVYTRILIASLGLRAPATSVSAECAWVLWEETQNTSFNPYRTSTEWRLGWSAETRDICQAALLGGFRSEAAQWSQKARDLPATYEFRSTEVGQMWTLNVKDGGQAYSSTLKRFICLPDTVDPRGQNSGK